MTLNSPYPPEHSPVLPPYPDLSEPLKDRVRILGGFFWAVSLAAPSWTTLGKMNYIVPELVSLGP